MSRAAFRITPSSLGAATFRTRRPSGAISRGLPTLHQARSSATACAPRRPATTRAGLEAATRVIVANSPPDASPADVRAELMRAGIDPLLFLEFEVRLESERTSGTAIITPRVSSMDVAHVCIPILG